MSSLFEERFALMSEMKSFYIPVLPTDILLNGQEFKSEESIKDFFELRLQVGRVARVDFIKKPTSNDHNLIAVFVHFESWERSVETDALIYAMNEKDEITLEGYQNHLKGMFVPFVSKHNKYKHRFLKMKINRSPIKTVEEIPKNMHQIVNNYGLMETLIEEQKKKIAELESIISKLIEQNGNTIDNDVDTYEMVKKGEMKMEELQA